MGSRADQHDLDKLGRWCSELLNNPDGKFPVYAVFVVSESDRAAHDIFRKYRDSFEELNAGFENLVIFGQHGVSGIARRLAAEFGLSEADIPVLALIERPKTGKFSTLSLPSGQADVRAKPAPAEVWQQVLAAVEQAAGEGDETRSLVVNGDLTRGTLRLGPLVELLGDMLDEVD